MNGTEPNRFRLYRRAVKWIAIHDRATEKDALDVAAVEGLASVGALAVAHDVERHAVAADVVKTRERLAREQLARERDLAREKPT